MVMRYNFYKIVIGFTTLTPILAAFKDFVIEKESDLQRFDNSMENMLYDENIYDELFYDDNDFMDKDVIQTVGGKYDQNVDLSSNHDIEEDNGWSVYEANIDEILLHQIMQHLAAEGDFQNLQNSWHNYQDYDTQKQLKGRTCHVNDNDGENCEDN